MNGGKLKYDIYGPKSLDSRIFLRNSFDFWYFKNECGPPDLYINSWVQPWSHTGEHFPPCVHQNPRGFNQCVQNRNRPEPCTPWTSVLVYICFCGGIMKITFFNFHDNFRCPIIFLWKMDMNSSSNSKCKYERIV